MPVFGPPTISPTSRASCAGSWTTTPAISSSGWPSRLFRTALPTNPVPQTITRCMSGEPREVDLAGRHEGVEAHVDVEIDAVHVARRVRAEERQRHRDVPGRRDRPADLGDRPVHGLLGHRLVEVGEQRRVDRRWADAVGADLVAQRLLGALHRVDLDALLRERITVAHELRMLAAPSEELLAALEGDALEHLL